MTSAPITTTEATSQRLDLTGYHPHGAVPVEDAPRHEPAPGSRPDGLSVYEIERLRAAHGSNTYPPLPTKSILDFIFGAFQDPMLRILVAAAALSVVLGTQTGEYADGVAITVAVLVVVLVGVTNELRAQRDYTALDAITARRPTKVIRDGVAQQVDSSELVVGDLVELALGDVIPADMVISSTFGLSVDESQITGEPESSKSVGDNLFAGSRLLDGRGLGVVSTVGNETTFGRIRNEIGDTTRSTPLQERLGGFAKQVGRVGTAMAVLTFATLVVVDILRGDLVPGLTVDFGEALLGHLTIAVTIIVVSVPEGLPLAVTLSLAYTTRRMAAERALVRELAACETMGSATVVCTDKTGTLTHGRMDVAGIMVRGVNVEPGYLADLDKCSGGVWSRAIASNTSADLVEEEGELLAVGNPTEAAMLRLLHASGVDYSALRGSHRVDQRVEFNSTRKYMSTTIVLNETDGIDRTEVHVKGAPEVVAEMCGSLDRGAPELLAAATGNGYRVIAMAVGPDAAHLQLLGLVLLEDILRQEVPASVQRCQQAGVAVKMITGDNPGTALEIACRSGIAERGSRVLTGPELRQLDDEELLVNLREVAVVARTLPDDKSRIARLLRDDGEVVAMTGDGVNDAPALVTADVGFAMGSGANVAREAGDVIVVDDDFSTIVRAIRWGRSVFENIRKFLMFQLTVNVVALTLTFSAALAGFGTPLTAVQLLWVNLIMDSLAAIALTLAPPNDDLYQQAPHGRTEPLVSGFMKMTIVITSFYMVSVLWLLLGTDLILGLDTAELRRTTIVFNVFVFMQLFNALNARVVHPGRSPFRGLGASGAFFGIMGTIAAVQVLLVTFGGSVFDTVALSWRDWVLSVAIGATVLLVAVATRRCGTVLTSAGRCGSYG